MGPVSPQLSYLAFIVAGQRPTEILRVTSGTELTRQYLTVFCSAKRENMWTVQLEGWGMDSWHLTKCPDVTTWRPGETTLKSDQASEGQKTREPSNSGLPWPSSCAVSCVMCPMKPRCPHSLLMLSLRSPRVSLRCTRIPLLPQGPRHHEVSPGL